MAIAAATATHGALLLRSLLRLRLLPSLFAKVEIARDKAVVLVVSTARAA